MNPQSTEVTGSNGVLVFPASEPMRAALLDMVRNESRRHPLRGARRSTRFPVINSLAIVRVEHPGGGIARGEALVADISETGLSVIWPGFVHVNTTCVVQVAGRNHTHAEVHGVVRWCQFLQGRFHSLGLKLDKPLDPRDFVDPKSWKEFSSASASTAAQPLVGRLLYLQPDQLHRDLLAMCLNGTQLNLEYASTTGEALDLLRGDGFDAVFCEGGSDPADAADFARILRREGFTCPLVALAPKGGVPAENVLTEAGFTQVLPRPLQADVLVEVIKKLLQTHADPMSGTTPIYSDLPNAAESAAWIERYIAGVVARAKDLRQLAADSKLAAVRAICDSITHTGESYGFPILTAASQAAVKALDASFSVEESMPQIRTLLRIVGRLRSHPQAVATVGAGEKAAAMEGGPPPAAAE